MNSRGMQIAFEELIRTTNPDLEFDITINTDVIFTFLSMAQIEKIGLDFLTGDSIKDNINAIRKRSDVLRNIIQRTTTTSVHSVQGDGGYAAIFNASDYWMFLGGIASHASFPTNNKGSDQTVIELDLINHYDLQKKVRTVNNEPIYKYIPIVLEGTNGFVFYLDKEKFDAVGGSINTVDFEITYLAYPPDITLAQDPSLPESTHNDIVKLAVERFIIDYKYKLNVASTKPNG